MKLLLIADTTDVRCGWGRYAFNISRSLDYNGIEYVMLTNLYSLYKNDFPIKNERQEILPLTPINLIKNILLLRKIISVEHIDAVHSFDVWPFSVYSTLATLGKHIPTFISGVGTYSLPPQRISFKKWLMRFALSRAAEVFCISNYTKKKIKERVKKANLTTVFWGVSRMSLVPQDKILFYRKKFEIRDSSSPIILTVGEIKNRKGQFQTLSAIKFLKDKYPFILYIVVGYTGDKVYMDKMRRFVDENNMNDNFMIVDYQKNDEELSFLYSIADVFAMNSNNEGDHFEGFGLVFLEAAQFGKPAVGSRGCGIEDAIVDGVTGYLTKQGDSVDIADKLEKVLSDKEKFGRAAQERVRELGWEKTADRYLKSYRRYV